METSEEGIASSAQGEKPQEDVVDNDLGVVCPRSPEVSHIKWVVLCSCLLLAEMQAALDSTITANLQPTIIDTFGEISKFPWINVSYSLGMGSTCLLWGKLLVYFDNKKILLLARAFFAIGSAVTAAAPSMDVFIVGKTITGVGGSGSYISVIAIITAFSSPLKRGQYFGYIGFVWGLGTILGPPIGGAFTVSDAGWRWSFYFNLILVGATFPVFVFILPPRKIAQTPAGFWNCVRRIDLVGSTLFAGALCSLIMALSFAGALYSWNSGAIISLFCSSGIIWLVFVIQQLTASMTTKEDRLLPVHVLHSWEMWILIILTGCSIGTLFVTIYYIPLYFQFVRGDSAIRSAVGLLPFLVTSVATILVSGHLIVRFGYYKMWFIAGSSLALTMSACLYTIDIETSYNHLYGYLILGGVGTGLYAMSTGPVMSAIVMKEYEADAGTVFGCVDTLCGAFAVGIANSIFINRASDSIQSILPDTPRTIVQEGIAGVGASLTKNLTPSLEKLVLQAGLDAIKDAWIQMIATGTLSLVLACCLRSRKLSDILNEKAGL